MNYFENALKELSTFLSERIKIQEEAKQYEENYIGDELDMRMNGLNEDFTGAKDYCLSRVEVIMDKKLKELAVRKDKMFSGANYPVDSKLLDSKLGLSQSEFDMIVERNKGNELFLRLADKFAYENNLNMEQYVPIDKKIEMIEMQKFEFMNSIGTTNLAIISDGLEFSIPLWQERSKQYDEV